MSPAEEYAVRKRELEEKLLREVRGSLATALRWAYEAGYRDGQKVPR